MKKLTATSILTAIVLLGASCTMPMKNGAQPTASPTPAAIAVPAPAPGEFKTITGTVVKTHFVKGWGFSHVDVAVVIQTAEGTSEFFARDNSMLITPDGQQIPIKKAQYKLFKDKQVEIKYSIITDATGGLEKYENGNNGIATMRVLD